MASGEKKYGLIDPKKKMTIADVFNNDSDSGDDRAMMKKRFQKDPEKGVKKQTIIDINRALEQDPTVYQYDEVYDAIKKPEKEAAKAVVVRKPKYMEGLLRTADKRKKENERRTERLVQKEREAEGDQFQDKEEFITSSYRQKLEEMKQAEEEEKKMEYIESIMDVTKQQDLGSFYRQLYKETVPEEANPSVDSIEKKTEEIGTVKEDAKEKTTTASKSSSSSDSSSDTSSSSDSSSEDDKEKKDKVAEVAEKSVADDAETKVEPVVDAVVKTSENDAKFNNTKKRDRTYRQRETSVKRSENNREPAKTSNLSSRRDESRSRRDDRGREPTSTRGRDRDRDLGRRDERRPPDRYRGGRNDDRRQRSRSRSRRDREEPRNSYNSDRRRPRDRPDYDRKERKPNEKRKREEDSSKSEKIEKETIPKQPDNNENVHAKGSEKKPEENINIWKKRTVDAVFEAALERYSQRKAARDL